MKFNDIPLNIPSLEEIVKKYQECILAVKEAKSADDVINLIKKVDKLDDDVQTDASVAQIKFSLDATNAEYQNVINAIGQVVSQTMQLSLTFEKEVLISEHLDEIKAKVGDKVIKKYENNTVAFDPKIVQDFMEDNKLSNEYQALLGSAQIEFNGNVYSVSEMRKYFTSKDRETRIASYKAVLGFFSENDEKIGEIFDKLVHLRDRMAKQLGYKNYVELGYRWLNRLDYDAKMVKSYREQIYKDVAPIVTELNKKQMKHLGIDNPLCVDYFIGFVEGNPKPIGDVKQLAKSASEMYHQMSKETGKLFDEMYNNGFMDLEARPGKVPGGFMSMLQKYKMPFLFANSNGTSEDVVTLTHEFGHAYFAYLASFFDIAEYRNATFETSEIHSIAMEFFSMKWMDKFFGTDAKRYEYMHLAGAIESLPYAAAIDEFQHWVYENVDVTHAERCAKWKEIDKKYRPWLNTEGFDYLEKGGYWIGQGHVFTMPFYFIDYALARVVAMQFRVEMNQDWNKAFNKYVELLKLSGKYSFVTLLEKVKLSNPFIDGNIKKAINPILKELSILEGEVYKD